MAEGTNYASSDEAPAAGVERRVRVRHAQALRTYCQPGQGDLDQIWLIGKLRDISASGIGLVVTRHFPPGTLLTLEVENAVQSRSQTVSVRVVRADPQPGGRWLLGCALSQELTAAELASLLE